MVDKYQLFERIRAAFADVPYPGDDNLGHPEGRDDGEQVTEWLRGRHWRSINPDELSSSALHFMTDEAFHYYFPAYLLGANSVEAGDAFDHILFVLTPPEQRDQPPAWLFPYFQKRYAKFTPAQKAVVREYIDWVLEDEILYCKKMNDPVDTNYQVTSLRALKDYWECF